MATPASTLPQLNRHPQTADTCLRLPASIFPSLLFPRSAMETTDAQSLSKGPIPTRLPSHRRVCAHLCGRQPSLFLEPASQTTSPELQGGPGSAVPVPVAQALRRSFSPDMTG